MALEQYQQQYAKFMKQFTACIQRNVFNIALLA